MKKFNKVIVIAGMILANSAPIAAMVGHPAHKLAHEARQTAISEQLGQVIDIYSKYGIDLEQQDERDRAPLMNLGLRALGMLGGSKKQKKRLLNELEAKNYNLFQSIANLRSALEELIDL